MGGSGNDRRLLAEQFDHAFGKSLAHLGVDPRAAGVRSRSRSDPSIAGTPRRSPRCRSGIPGSARRRGPAYWTGRGASIHATCRASVYQAGETSTKNTKDTKARWVCGKRLPRCAPTTADAKCLSGNKRRKTAIFYYSPRKKSPLTRGTGRVGHSVCSTVRREICLRCRPIVRLSVRGRNRLPELQQCVPTKGDARNKE